MNPPGRWCLVLVIQKSRKGEKRREICSNLSNSKPSPEFTQTPKHSKTPLPKISVLYHARKKSLCIYKRGQKHTLSTKYQQGHTEGRGLNTVLFLADSAKELRLYHSTGKILHSEHGLSTWRMLKQKDALP